MDCCFLFFCLYRVCVDFRDHVWEDFIMRFETELHTARGLGSAKSGLHHWIVQRITALALIPLGLWIVYAFIVLITAPYIYVREWLSSPWTVTFSILLMICMFYHGYLGMRVIVEDYVSQTFLKWALIIGTKILSLLMAVLGIISILKVFLS